MPDPPVCPVCSEPLPDRPDRCFRCETPLRPWWPFEDALSTSSRQPQALSLQPATVASPSRSRARTLGTGLALVMGGAVLGFLGRSPDRPDPPRPSRPSPPALTHIPSPSPRPASPTTITYRVQRGDSLWRIAAALTGEGSRWRELWPDRPDHPLLPGTLLEVPSACTAP